VIGGSLCHIEDEHQVLIEGRDHGAIYLVESATFEVFHEE
jgi:hypothetical protein